MAYDVDLLKKQSPKISPGYLLCSKKTPCSLDRKRYIVLGSVPLTGANSLSQDPVLSGAFGNEPLE